MFTNRLFYLLMVVVFAVTACAPQVSATPTQSEPITLRLAIADEEGRPSDPYVHEFINQVKALSNGKISLEPLWDAGASTDAGFEVGVVQLVKEGRADLGLAASRAFDNENITSFQALQAPFLITNDALSKAVAASDIGTRMLARLSTTKMVGLTLWPEDLRHPFSVIPDKPILSPKDFEGVTVRVTPSKISYLLIETFGGSPMSGDDDYQAAESGLRQGFSLTGTPAATGNVIFFAKYQVLFANGMAFEKLSEAQRNILREAAAATQQKAITEHPSEVETGTAWCTDGGTVIMASTEQVAAFEAAAKPVFEKITQDPVNAELIAAIRELKSKTAPPAGASACAPDIAQTRPDSNAETQVWSPGLPPNGVWQAELTIDDFVSMGVLRSVAETDWAGVYTIAFFNGHLDSVYQSLHGGVGKCQANYEVVKDFVRINYYPVGDQCTPAYSEDVQWRVDEKGLHLHMVNIEPGTHLESKAYYEAKPWQKMPDDTEIWSMGLPPNGVWQVELTPDDFIMRGTLKSTANDMAGVYTWTFQDGNAKIDYKGPGGGFICLANMEFVDDVARLTYFNGDACVNEVDDIQWRLDPDGLHLHLVAIQNSNFINNKAQYEAKPWQKIVNP